MLKWEIPCIYFANYCCFLLKVFMFFERPLYCFTDDLAQEHILITMDSTDVYRLNRIKPDLLDSVDANHIVDFLIEKEVLDPDDDESIRAGRTPQERTETLIQILPQRTPDALKQLRQALLENHRFIVTKLDAVEVPAARKTYSTSAGAGGLNTAAAAAAAKKITEHCAKLVPTTTNTYNIKGGDNFVIIGGNNTEINVHKD